MIFPALKKPLKQTTSRFPPPSSHGMNEEPEIPEPIPKIPRGWIWLTLAAPPAVTFIFSIVTVRSPGNTPLLVPLIIMFPIIAQLPYFKDAVGQRYRGVSLTFLTWAYFLGETIVCLAIWIGFRVIFYLFP